MRPIAEAVSRALRALGVDREVARAQAIGVWAEAATSVLGPDALATRAMRADGETLVVSVPTAQWAGEIRLRERDLVMAVADRAPNARITRIRPVPGSTPTT